MIVCVKCNRQMRPKKNGVDLVEMARAGNGAEYWPYKVWEGDLWECQDCGTEVVYVDGNRQTPMRENHQEGFERMVEAAQYRAKEWSR